VRASCLKSGPASDVKELLPPSDHDAALAQDGDPFGISVYRRCGEYLGRGLAIIVDLLNPERIVIGSIFTRSRALLYDAMMETLTEEALPRALAVCSVVPAELGENLGAYAALSVASGEF